MRVQDRRKFIRLKAYHLVKYRLLSKEKEQSNYIYAALKDVGAGGVCLDTEEYLPMSSLIELKINFPNVATSVFALAKVAWMKKRDKGRRYEVGAQFVEIDESMRKIIDEQVKRVEHKLKKKKLGLLGVLFNKGGIR